MAEGAPAETQPKSGLYLTAEGIQPRAQLPVAGSLGGTFPLRLSPRGAARQKLQGGPVLGQGPAQPTTVQAGASISVLGSPGARWPV